jgi:hypothetical protein
MLCERVMRFPWGHFPPVIIHVEEKLAKAHGSYRAAKRGDVNEAYRLAAELTSPACLETLDAMYGKLLPTLVSAHAIERDGLNAIPETLADYLAARLGWPVNTNILQTNVVGHTGADGFTRLARQARFGGDVEAGRIYFLVDDFVGQGGTLANLRGYLMSKGGIVLGATVLTGKSYSATMALQQPIIDELRVKHGHKLEHWWKERFGFGFECLTNSEGIYLRNTETAERIRDRIAAAGEG